MGDRRCGDRQGEEGDHQGDPRADAADVGQEEGGEEGDEEAEEGQEEEEEEGQEEEKEEEGQEEEEKEEEKEEEGREVPGRQAAEGRSQEQGVEGCGQEDCGGAEEEGHWSLRHQDALRRPRRDCGKNKMARPEVVKALWAYIKKNKLSKGRTITPDAKLKKVLPAASLSMFKMATHLKKHIK